VLIVCYKDNTKIRKRIDFSSLQTLFLAKGCCSRCVVTTPLLGVLFDVNNYLSPTFGMVSALL
ncbi:MAG: hypothetical protein IKK05_01470, partial [Alistipes sp.]|nr:hypothetical protein [Alistipes sp.]